MRYFLFILISFLLWTPAFSQAAVYRWQDDQGHVGFTDNPENIPEKYRQSATQLDGTSTRQKPQTEITPTAPLSTDATENAVELDDQGRDEQWWRARVQELHQRKKMLLAEKERLMTNIDPLGNLGLGSIEANQKSKEIKDRRGQIDSEIEEIEYNLNVLLPEEAREANAPPGWLRE